MQNDWTQLFMQLSQQRHSATTAIVGAAIQEDASFFDDEHQPPPKEVRKRTQLPEREHVKMVRRQGFGCLCARERECAQRPRHERWQEK